MTTVHWLWIGWIAAGVGLELFTIFNRVEGDTLSESVWSVLRIQGWGKFVAWMLTAFLLWLAAHFASRGRLG